MKVALVHDYIKEYGGAERVLEALHGIYPNAIVYTSVYLPKYLGPHQSRFSNWKIKTSLLQYIPFKEKLISPIRILSPLAFKSFDFSEFDLIIVSATGAYFPNSLNKKSAKQVCYCHTPPRYLYGYATARGWKKNRILNVVGEIANHFLRMADFSASKNVDFYIANSEEVKSRIKKFYRKDAVVINPPVVKSKVKSNKSKVKNSQSYFLAGGRLARPKHIDLIIDAFLENKLPLKIFGKGFAGYGDELMSKVKNQNSKIEFVGEVTDEEKLELLLGSKAFINASEDEDFGILPVEAMSQGTPVIAYRSGGLKETVVDGKTGVFFDELNIKSLNNAINKLNKLNIKSEDCISHAKKYSLEEFSVNIKKFITKIFSG